MARIQQDEIDVARNLCARPDGATRIDVADELNITVQRAVAVLRQLGDKVTLRVSALGGEKGGRAARTLVYRTKAPVKLAKAKKTAKAGR